MRMVEDLCGETPDRIGRADKLRVGVLALSRRRPVAGVEFRSNDRNRADGCPAALDSLCRLV